MWYNVIIKASLVFKAFLQSVGLASYILLVSQFIQNFSKLGNLGSDLGSLLFLLLYCERKPRAIQNTVPA